MRWTAPLLFVVLAAAPVSAAPEDAPADDAPAADGACDAAAIDWVLPGHFDDALKRAKDTRRILIVKGVSFGIDELGAKCATKGHW